MIHPSLERVSLSPFWADLRSYQTRWLRFDLQAGATVALFAVPQVMAYAMLAGLPPAHGLYAAAVMSIVAALWGSSPFINSGPSNSASLLAASALVPFAVSGNPQSLLPLVFQFTLLVGILRVTFGLLKLGHLVRFVPESATLGFVSGAGILIALGQMNHFLGVENSHLPNFLLRLLDVLSRIGDANGLTLSIGTATLICFAVFDRFSKRFPVALTIIATATALVHFEKWSVATVRDIAPIPVGLPPFSAFALDFSRLGEMFGPALAVAVIGLIEAVAIGQTLALRHSQKFEVNQEFFGQGLSQIVSAFFGGLPGSGSFSRSALIEQCGGKTRLANIFFGVLIGACLIFAPGLLEKIPTAALAGLLFYSGFKLVSFQDLRRVYRTDRGDAGVLALTFFVTVFIKIEWGFFVGAMAALLIFLSRAKELQLFEIVPDGTARGWQERPYSPNSSHDKSAVVALSLHGDLFFGLAHALREQLTEILVVQEPQFVVIRLRRAASIDFSCWSALFDFAQSFQKRGGKLYLSGVRPEMCQLIQDAEMTSVLPSKQLVSQTDAPWSAFHESLERVGAQIDAQTQLAAPWRQFFDARSKSQSISFGRDPFNDPATLGFSEFG